MLSVWWWCSVLFFVTGEFFGIPTEYFVSYLTNAFWLLEFLDLHEVTS